KTVVFKTNRIDKSFTSSDTLYRTAICSIYIEPEDEIGMYFVQNIKSEEDTLYHRIYDGKHFSNMTIYVDGMAKAKWFTRENLEQNNNIQGHFGLNFLCRNIFELDDNFTRFRNKSERDKIKKMEVYDEIYQNTPVYVLTIFFKNQEDSDEYINNAVDKYYIRKSDFLPIAYSFYGEFQGMQEYEFATIDYLEINTLTLKDFIPYNIAVDVDVEAVYEQNKSLFEEDPFRDKVNGKIKKKDSQKVIEVEIMNDKFPFNEFVLNNSDTVKLSELKGKVVLLDFWYRGCLPCIKAIPVLNELQNEFKDDLVVIGINDVDDNEQVNDFLKYKKVDYFSTYKSEINISKSLKFNAFPTMVFLDKNGDVATIKIGFDDENNNRKLI